jgi:hypothetical protein
MRLIHEGHEEHEGKGKKDEELENRSALLVFPHVAFAILTYLFLFSLYPYSPLRVSS